MSYIYGKTLHLVGGKTTCLIFPYKWEEVGDVGYTEKPSSDFSLYVGLEGIRAIFRVKQDNLLTWFIRDILLTLRMP